MKKIALKSVLILIMFFAFLGCSSDNNSDSIPIPIVKTKVTITKIQVTTIPNINGSGFDWDTFTNPDIYLKVYDEIGNSLGTTGTLYDFFPTVSNPFFVTSTIYTTDLINTVIKVQVWDNDSNDFPPDSDDKIGEVPFYIYDYTLESNKYPSYAVKSYNGTTITIYMTWE